MLPKVSAYCPTYGRPYVLEESIESFLKQDYKGEKELIILNDYEGHNLYFDHPEVKVFNVKKHIVPLGKKFNETIKLCTGDILFAWEDDDIFLPHRISYSVEKILTSKKNMFHSHEAFLELPDGLFIRAYDYHKNHSLFHSAVAVTKELMDKVNGYYEDSNDLIFFDQFTMNKFFSADNYQTPAQDIKESFYIYRHSVNDTYNSSNFSGWTNTRGQLSISAELYLEKNKNNIPKGDYYLKPNWKKDYINITKEYLANYSPHK